VENDVVTVEDLESINGTFLNGARVRDVEVVRPGDRLTIGPVMLLVQYTLTPAALERLGGAEEVVVLEAGDEVEIVGGSSEAEVVAVADEELPMAEAADDEDAELFIFDEEPEEVVLEEGDGNDFIIELDDTEKRPKKRKQ
jgi:hypothetical protein